MNVTGGRNIFLNGSPSSMHVRHVRDCVLSRLLLQRRADAAKLSLAWMCVIPVRKTNTQKTSLGVLAQAGRWSLGHACIRARYSRAQ